MTAQDALAITNNNSYRKDALTYAISNLEERIKKYAASGKRTCLVDFHSHPGPYLEFEAKYGADKSDDYHMYDIEEELREHFVKNGFSFKLIRDDICGGVRQDPYWTICW